MVFMEFAATKETRRIVALLDRPSPVTHVHLFGLNSSAASTTFHEVLKILRDSKCIVLPVNMLLVNGSVQNFCCEVLRKISTELSELEACKIKTLSGLFDALSLLLANKTRPIIIAINRAEQILQFPNVFALTLFKCIKKENGKIKALTISQLPWSKIESTCMLSIPVQFSFKSFTKEELLELLQKELGKDRSEIKLSIDLTYATCRDVRLLKHMIKSRDSLNNEKHLKNSMKNMVNYYATSGLSKVDCHAAFKANTSNLNLPLSETLLLIAAYCATYNPPTSDCRIFGNTKSKASFEAAQRRKTAVFEKIPKPFDLQRLHFIYLALLRYFNLELYKDSNLFVLVNDLCLLGLLVKVSADSNLDLPKYKCIATDELLMKAAHMLGEQDLNNFLSTG